MASTIKLQDTITLSSRYIYNAPLLFVNDGVLAFSIGDWIRQFILAPPFAWRWNRGVVPPITCTIGTSDYPVYLPDFGWIEKAWLVGPAVGGSPPVTIELTVLNNISPESIQNKPLHISPVLDDNNGNITFRLFGTPDQAYTLYINYQKCAPSFSSVLDTWAPIPDYLSYLYNQGFMAKAYEYKADVRFAFAYQQFLRQVLAANDGLSESAKNLFLEPRLISTREQQGVTQSGQLSRQGRGGY